MTNQQVYAWLGYWRDKMPPEAVSQLQDILGPLRTGAEPKAPDFRALLEEAWKAADGNEGDHVLGSDLNERIKSALNLLAEPKGCQLQNARVCAEWPACVCGRTLGSVVNRTAEGK
jgi:hypothetical protein